MAGAPRVSASELTRAGDHLGFGAPSEGELSSVIQKRVIQQGMDETVEGILTHFTALVMLQVTTCVLLEQALIILQSDSIVVRQRSRVLLVVFTYESAIRIWVKQHGISEQGLTHLCASFKASKSVRLTPEVEPPSASSPP